MGREEKFPSSGFIPPHACWLCYILVLVGFILCFLIPQHPDPWYNGLIASLETTVLSWIFAVYYRNTSIYDPYWAFYPLFLSACWMATAGSAPSGRSWLCFALIWVWLLRYNLQWIWEGWTIGIHTEDWRYPLMAKSLGLTDSVGVVYWVCVSLIGAHIIPTLLVWFVLSPVQPLWTAGSHEAPPLGLQDVIGAALSLFAVSLQYISDETLRKFRSKHIKGDRSAIETSVCPSTCTEGPWGFSRHPNYCGEVLFWWGMNIVAGNGGGTSARLMWSIGGVVNYTFFFRVSASLMDARSLRNRPGFDKVMAKIPGLLPIPVMLDNLLDKVLIREEPKNGHKAK